MSASAQILWRTVLGSVAVWSAGVLGVVESGLGARFSLHPDAEQDESQVPKVELDRGKEALGSIDQYVVIADRPLFNPDRRPLPKADGPKESAPEEAPPLNVQVTSIVITADKKLVIVTDPNSKTSQTVALGASLEGEFAGWKLTELSPRKAVFSGAGGVKTSAVDLRVFDGQGGEAPTAAAPVEAPVRDQPVVQEEKAGDAGNDSPESRAEQIRRRIEERRRQMREEAERAKAERGQ